MLSLFFFFFLHVYSIVFPLPIVLFSLFNLLYLKYLPFALLNPLSAQCSLSWKPGPYRLCQQNEVSVFILLAPSLRGYFRQTVSLNHRPPLLSRWLILHNSPLPTTSFVCPFRSGVVIAPLLLRLGSSTISVVPLHPAHTFVISSFADKLSSPYPHLHVMFFVRILSYILVSLLFLFLILHLLLQFTMFHHGSSSTIS